MNERIEKAYAKLNLSLDILGLLPGGYHELCSVMQSVSLCDRLTIRSDKGSGSISVSTDKAYLPGGEKNLAGRAARLFLRHAGITDADIDIHIEKSIPVGAGLGGGSSDAAAVLRGLNAMFGAPFPLSVLEQLGAQIGSDVPYCVQGGTVLAGGRGEIMQQLRPMPHCGVLLCKPAFSASTAELFALADKRTISGRPDTNGLLSAIEKGDLTGICQRVFNVFEEVMVRGRDEVLRIKELMYDCGALGASMSGTGPTVFGLFGDIEGAERAETELKKHWADCAACVPMEKICIN